MKTEVRNRENKEEHRYPYLGILRGFGCRLIVLFKGKNCGTVLNAEGSWTVGDWHDTWDESAFDSLPLEKEVTLSNQ